MISLSKNHNNIILHEFYIHRTVHRDIFLYLLSLLLFVAKNVDHFRLNSDIHDFNTKNKSNLHLPPSKLTVFQRGPYYSGIKALNNLPIHVKNLLQANKQFNRALKDYLHSNSFYSLNEFYNSSRP